MDSECLSLAVITMNDVAYLQSQRMTDDERQDFRNTYGLSETVPVELHNPYELYEAHSHHEESHYGGSH